MTTPLLPNTLYICLFLRSDPPLLDDFHWALYHHTTKGGMKYHITNEGRGWIAGHSRESPSSILKSFLLVGLIRVAGVNNISANADDMNRKIDGTLRSHDGKLNDKDFITCRIWLLEMLGILYMEGLLADVRCGGDMKMLERVVKQWGNGFAEGAMRNVQPRPVEN
ncbi:hypothetical protein ASPSYDRAFT_742805 [Aspergillus sydowii CBS 593.65]|uniref:Uncharacterized protein n=1 Tax=Aspergillus sydowii CBS 593.65 TaxID=1036612 RepID=A0A1L9TMF1_9EURO|nr:uncharacterized protein ASPSYDRAFT_742805 [Aspergillus sydowii CBS 593.65]OJJ60572.1 hypothetical protein ASPSYDRAFT_742805 [Aspergillus sydowii CBS 593.65]